jgi:HEPN domain-containing protein
VKYRDLKILADMRLDDVKVLYHAGRYDGAVYLCGYVLEIALKARICKLLDLTEYPLEGKFKQTYATHDFSVLLKLSGLENQILLSKTKQPDLFISWSLVTGWYPAMRYEILNKSKKEVGDILVALIDILKWLKKSW